MAVNNKRVFYVKYLANQIYADILRARPDVRLDRLENESPDEISAPILIAAHAYQIGAARDELAPRFHVVSDSVYLSGKSHTGRISHDVVMGTTGYRFASYSAVTGPPKTALCTSNVPLGVCQANISAPLIVVPPVEGIFSYAKTSPSTGIFGSSIIRQQGISLGNLRRLTQKERGA